MHRPRVIGWMGNAGRPPEGGVRTMTTRKPPNVSFPSWIEHQIRTAQARGAFDDLPGTGKPIPNLDRPQNELSWVADDLRRENVELTEVLPEALALAKEVELLPDRLQRERSEPRARRVVEDLNERISRAHARPQIGPPVRVKTVDVDAALQARRDQLAVLAATPQPAARPGAERSSRRRRWFRG
jgi:pyruvate/2-oxoglutarate dehydrogenase complex dihydrolipoamide acyltransferase (E2) component